MTINGVIPAMSPITVALAPRLSAYRKIGLSMMIWQDKKLRKKSQKRLWMPLGNFGLAAGSLKAGEWATVGGRGSSGCLETPLRLVGAGTRLLVEEPAANGRLPPIPRLEKQRQLLPRSRRGRGKSR